MIPSLAEAAVTMSQSVELSILAKATAIVAAGLVAVRMASHARASVRHLLLATTFASLVALPLLLVAGPLKTIDVPVAYTRPSVAPSAPVRPAVAPQTGVVAAPIVEREALKISGLTMARTVWIVGAVTFLAPVPIVLWRLRRIRRTGLPWSDLRAHVTSLAADRGIGRPVELMRHEHVPGPITFGVMRPVIVLPADANEWPEADLRRAIVHELEHIQRCDWVVLLAARSICACYWFHPLAWVAWRQLSLEAERSCDDAVVLIEERTDYADQLVTLAQRLSATEEAPMLGMANRSDLSTRVSAVLDDRQRRGRAGLGPVAGAIGVASLVVLGVAPLTAVARVESGNAVVASPATDDAQDQRSAREEEVRKAMEELAKKLEQARASNDTTKLEALMRARAELESRQNRPRVRALDRALYEAADAGDPKEVDEILAAGADPNAAIPGDGSPLIAAARSGVLPIVERLVILGADPNMPVPGDGSPLIMAAAHGHLDVVRYLLDRGADVDLIVPGDENALMCAAEQGHLAIVQLLVKRGANVNERILSERSGRNGDGEWRTAVSQASKNGHTAVVSFLKSAGARE